MGESGELDFESATGSSPSTGPVNGGNSSSSMEPGPFGQAGISNQNAVQCLLKGDKVFSMTWVNGGGWSSFISGPWSKKNCKFLTGNVIANKDWSQSKLMLQIRWENGYIESLSHEATDIAYGNHRVFVLDRQCIFPGSKVFLVGHPEIEGTVTGKRFLATGNVPCSDTTDWVYEDADTTKLRRETHGNGYKDNKILYRGWIGVTSGYRTRVCLKSKSDVFSIVVDGSVSERFFIGEEINLGFRILRSAEFVEGEAGQNWLVNFFKYYNTAATVVKCEIEDLLICWIGRACDPNTPATPYELSNTPEEVISHEDLCHVHYLFGDSHNHMTPKTLWIHDHPQDESLMTKNKWARKWRKIMDWDRWEYPANDVDACAGKPKPFDKHLTLDIMYTRSVVDVLWSNGSISTVNSGDVIPVAAGSVWSEMMKFHIGSIVRDRLNPGDSEKYGIITSLADEVGATVKWIIPTVGDGNPPTVTLSTTSLHNLAENSEYEFILKTGQCPLVCCGKDKTLGVVLGTNPENHKCRVKIVNRGAEECYWPHEIKHYKCDVLLCPIDNRWTLWYEHLAPPSGITRVVPDPLPSNVTKDDETATNPLSSFLGFTSPKEKFTSLAKVPLDNIFAREDLILPTRETDFHQSLDREITEMSENLPVGMWVERYTERADILSAIVTGPKDSVFEDFIFIFDMFLMEDFPRSEPHINFRSMGLTLIPGRLCKTGAVVLPEETRLAEDDFSLSSIQNILLEVRDFLGLPLEVIHEKNAVHTLGIKPEDPEELHKFVKLALLDYALALLRKPPVNWRSVIVSHFAEALPRIIDRCKKGGFEIKRPVATISNEKGMPR